VGTIAQSGAEYFTTPPDTSLERQGLDTFYFVPCSGGPGRDIHTSGGNPVTRLNKPVIIPCPKRAQKPVAAQVPS